MMTPEQFNKLPRFARDALDAKDREIEALQSRVSILEFKLPDYMGEPVGEILPLGYVQSDFTLPFGKRARLTLKTDHGAFEISLRDGVLEISDSATMVMHDGFCITPVASNVIRVTQRPLKAKGE